MRLRQARGAFRRGVLLLAVLGWIPVTFAVPRPELAGTVRNAVGSLLADVEVLVLRERGPDPVAVARTDPSGRFLLDLPLGTYRVMAVKDGYATWLGRVSVAFRTTLDLVLQPAAADPTLDPDWALRVPDRSLLRETDAAALLEEEGRGGTTVARDGVDRLIQGEVEHVVHFGADAVAGPRAHLEGGDTRLVLSSHPGERTSVRLEGRKHALDAATPWDRSELALDLDYDTSLDGQLALQAFYGARDGGPVFAPETSRVWGYDASWSRRFSPTSRMTAGIAYLDTGIEAPISGPGPAAGRALRAGTSYATRFIPDHDMTLRVQARSAEMSVLDLLAADGPGGPSEIGLPAGVPDPLGWGVRLDVQDAWHVRTPLTFLVGVGYETDVTGEGPGSSMQQVGLAWSEADLQLDLRLSHHAVTASDAVSVPVVDDAYGWSAAAEFPIGARVRVRGEASDAPVADGGLSGPVPGLVLDRAAFVTDGLAATRARRLTLEHEARSTRAFVQMEQGSARGGLAVVRPADQTVGALEAQELAFVAGRLGMRLVPTGTAVTAEYRRVLATGSVEGESVELRIAQDLVRLQSRGAAWRLLLAARAIQDGKAAADGSGEGTQHWMGAGISLAF
ncbi:MAG TPA: carboxypeptidase-like regulatory domain-containing protein [Candidatus Polarisedimenticolaceae bacterium]|nr:carboxypeptidase-like regulatory domain-containing protein [Candidatus Polarisedimenticolaceae bacterium]